MGCNTGVMRFERTVWTKRSTTSIFVPFYRGDALKERGCKIDFRLSEVEGNTQARPAIRYSNDGGKTWSSPVAMSTTWTSSTSWVHLDHFHAVDNDYLLFEVGLEVGNTSGTGQGTARVEIIVTMAAVLDLEIGRDVQKWYSGLDDIGGIVVSDGTFVVGNASGDWIGRTAAQVRGILDLEVGTDVQAWDAGLDDLAAITVADGTFVVGNASGDWIGRTPAQVRGILDLEVGTDVQAWDAGLDDLAAITVADGTFIVGNASGDWIGRTPAQVRDVLDLDTTNDVQFTRLGLGVAPNASYSLNTSAAINIGVASGIALRVNGAEALWWNGTYFSWGYDGSYNFFADDIQLGGVLRVLQDSSPPTAVTDAGLLWVRNDNPPTLMYTDDGGADYPVAGNRSEAWIHLLSTTNTNLKGIAFNPWDTDFGASISTGASKNITYTATTGRCTVSFGGVYKVDCAMILEKDSGSGSCVMYVKVNGATAISRGVVIDTSPRLFTISTIVQLVASDYVEVTLSPPGNMTMNDDSNLTIFRIGGVE